MNDDSACNVACSLLLLWLQLLWNNLHVKTKQTIHFRFVHHWICDAIIIISSGKSFYSVVLRFQMKKIHCIIMRHFFAFFFIICSSQSTGNIQCWLPSYRQQMQSLRIEAILSQPFQIIFIILKVFFQSFIDQLNFNWRIKMKKIFQITMRAKLWQREKSRKTVKKRELFKKYSNICAFNGNEFQVQFHHCAIERFVNYISWTWHQFLIRTEGGIFNWCKRCVCAPS